MYWLALDDNDGPTPDYPTHFRIDDAMTDAQDMGATVVRAWADTVGCSLCIEPSLGTFNDSAFQSLDYAVASARAHGIRLILTLVDNWGYYNGGKPTYVKWRGATEDQFFSSPTLMGDYEAFIDHVVTHVNTVTGIAYNQDPTIMGWETGNEMYCQTCSGNFWDGSWTRQIADHLKTVAPRQLVVDGHGVDNSCTSSCLSSADLAVPSVDVIDDHYYPMHDERVANASEQAVAAGKAYMVGEFDWDSHDSGGDSLSDFLSTIEASPAVGDLSWVLVPHADVAGLEDHNDGFQLYWPAMDAALQPLENQLRSHAFQMKGQATAPAYAPVGAPTLDALASWSSGIHMTWRGAADGATYTVQRSTDGGATWTTAGSGLHEQLADANPGWTDTGAPAQTSLSYRVAAVNLDGMTGPWSDVMRVNS